ncbi:GNAT family N-acetyltransferase [Brenneria uluponensis]|uniref:GNAT family N-acetyltransferase n=1 Tax=Brenneria uluponensis TaxID=3057057 RepID=UPI0028E9D1F7|nr:GNAT family N-acetyltransferase [Brenneria ulupoensis]
MNQSHIEITYKINVPLTIDQFTALLAKTTLGPRRPLTNRTVLEGMLAQADLLISAWHNDELVGIARSVTDFCYCCYLSDLAVDENIQHHGIGKRLIKETARQLSPQCKIVLLAAPQAVGYYPKIGFEKHTSAWVSSANQFME